MWTRPNVVDFSKLFARAGLTPEQREQEKQESREKTRAELLALTLATPTALEQWNDLLDGMLSAHETSVLLCEPNLWAVPGLAVVTSGTLTRKDVFNTYIIEHFDEFHAWLVEAHPELCDGLLVADAIRRLKNGAPEE